MKLSFDHIQQSLAHYTPERQPVPAHVRARASVAMILSGDDDNLHLCFIQRTTRDDDAWSGHMAFPGGRAHPEDASTHAVAMRETHEEVGVVLDEQHLIGALDEIELYGRGQDRHGVLSPFVFMIPGALPTLTPDPREVAQAYWIPVRDLYSSASFTTYVFSHPETQDTMEFPGIAYEEQIIWGLTYRVLARFAELMAWPLPDMR